MPQSHVEVVRLRDYETRYTPKGKLIFVKCYERRNESPQYELHYLVTEEDK